MIKHRHSRILLPSELSEIDFGDSNYGSRVLLLMMSRSLCVQSAGLLSLSLIPPIEVYISSTLDVYNISYDSLSHVNLSEIQNYLETFSTYNPFAGHDYYLNFDSKVFSIYNFKNLWNDLDNFPAAKHFASGIQHGFSVLGLVTTYIFILVAVLTSTIFILHQANYKKYSSYMKFLALRYDLIDYLDVDEFNSLMTDTEVDDAATVQLGDTRSLMEEKIQINEADDISAGTIHYNYSMRHFNFGPNDTPYGTLRLSNVTLPSNFPQSLAAFDYEDFSSTDIDQ